MLGKKSRHAFIARDQEAARHKKSAANIASMAIITHSALGMPASLPCHHANYVRERVSTIWWNDDINYPYHCHVESLIPSVRKGLKFLLH